MDNRKECNKVFGIDFHYFLIFICFVYFALGVYSMFKIWAVGDEPEDFSLAHRLIFGFGNFFQKDNVPNQARLSHLISFPLVELLKEKALIPLRILFFLSHFVYLWVSYRLLVLVTENRRAAAVYVLLLATSLFLQSFSIFVMSTGDPLFLLFHVVCIYLFSKGCLEQKKTGVPFPWIPFILCMALCIASKLFGVFLMATIFLYHMLDRSVSGVVIRGRFIRALQIYSLFFIFFIFLINFINFAPLAKSYASFVFGLIYLGIFLYFMTLEKNSSKPSARISKSEFWATTTLAVFNLTLLFSPIYFNLENVLWPSWWIHKWQHGDTTRFASIYDIPSILILKYGLLSFSVLILSFPLFLLSRQRARAQEHGKENWFFLLIALIFSVHFFVVFFGDAKSVWYPLVIFPFLYLPFVWMWLQAERSNSKRQIVLIIVCLFLVVADNVYRYAKWYPYGHFDGAQYGRKFIGWDKPGYVSFEAIPLVYSLITSFDFLPVGREIKVSCRFLPVRVYNHYAASSLGEYFQIEKKDNRFNFFAELEGEERKSDLLLTSPLYYPSLDEELSKDGQYQKLATITIKGIDMMSTWRKKSEEEAV